MKKVSMVSLGSALALALTLASVTVATSNSKAETYLAPGFTCQKEAFVTPPVMDGDVFKSTITADCELVGATGAGLAALDRFLVAKATQDVEKVHSGPTETTLNGVKGVKYDVTTRKDKDGMRIRQDVVIAFEALKGLSYAMISKELIDGGMVKKLDNQFDFTAVTAAGRTTPTYRVKATTTLHLKKPMLLPGGAFKSVAEKRAAAAFVEKRDEALRVFMNQL